MEREPPLAGDNKRGKREPKRPTHELVIKDTGHGRTVAGAAWFNEEDGTYAIKLSPCVVISYESVQNKFMKLVPLPPDAKPGGPTRTTKLREWVEQKAREE